MQEQLLFSCRESEIVLISANGENRAKKTSYIIRQLIRSVSLNLFIIKMTGKHNVRPTLHFIKLLFTVKLRADSD